VNLRELKQQTAEILNFNPRQVNQDFTVSQITRALNRAYAREVAYAEQEGSRRYFMAQQEATWPANDLRFVLPAGVAQKGLIKMDNITNGNVGRPMLFSDSGLNGELFWVDHRTLQYGSSAPGEDIDIRFTYYSQAEDLVHELDEPSLLPPPFDQILPWTAAIDLRRAADEGSPQEWKEHREELRIDFWKFVARGRPADDVPWVGPRPGELSNEIFYY